MLFLAWKIMHEFLKIIIQFASLFPSKYIISIQNKCGPLKFKQYNPNAVLEYLRKIK